MSDLFMQQAMLLAEKARGLTSPNPCVGAVIVKGGKIVGSGFHAKAGKDHAEVIAIQEVMKQSGITTLEIDPNLFRNATLYVTLEPCAHVAKTGACVDKVIEAGFAKVVIGMKDPFALVNGRGIVKLKKAGIKVEVLKSDSKIGLEVRKLNQPFIKWASTGLPYVILKSGLSLDGKIATSTGESKWITNKDSRRDARRERSLCDCVLVGSGTVRADDPELAAHGKFRHKDLLRVVIDRKLTLSADHSVFRDKNVFVATTKMASQTKQKKFRNAGIPFKLFGKEVNVLSLLKYLAKMGVQSVFIEGGSEVAGLFHDAALKKSLVIDKVIYYIEAILIGGRKSIPLIAGDGVSSLKSAIKFDELSAESIGGGLKITAHSNFY